MSKALESECTFNITTPTMLTSMSKTQCFLILLRGVNFSIDKKSVPLSTRLLIFVITLKSKREVSIFLLNIKVSKALQRECDFRKSAHRGVKNSMFFFNF